jgi:beta-phosphoglucomutase
MSLRAIILDFDGTIVESVGIKDDAFEELFKDYPARLNDVMAYHKAHNAIIRFEKFRHIYENILLKEYSPAVEEEMSRKFSELVYSKIVRCPYVKGAEEFLGFFSKKMPLYLVSVNPAGELERILLTRGLAGYFKKIYAFPWRKAEAINEILHEENISRGDALFIGDAWEDFLAARDAGVPFIGRHSGRPFQDASVRVFEDLDEIGNFIRSRNI